MLMLLFHIDKDLYAIDSKSVVEVIPRVPLRTIHQVPKYVAGLFNYRGTIVPVIDLCDLIRANPSKLSLSTRIIMVRYPLKNNTLQYLGLIAERITETLTIPKPNFVDSGIRVSQAPYLGSMIMNEKGIIQCIELEKLFTESQHTYLLTAGEGYAGKIESN